MDVPRFRYLDDVRRFLDSIEKDLDDSGKVIVQQQKMLASKLLPGQPVKASMVFNVTPTDVKDQRSLVRRMKTKIDPSLTKVVVPNLEKLKSQYAMAEDLYDKLRGVEKAETTLNLTFPDRRGEAFEATMAQIARMKTKISDQLKLCLGFLSEIAEAHVPKQFTKYVQMVSDMVNEHVIFKDSHTFLYVSVAGKGDLLFTQYIMLQDVANDEGSIAPHLYISIQWRIGKESSMTVDLNHEYEVPNKLIDQGEEVGSVGEAVRAISEMLDLENFSSALGVVPLALQLNVDPTTLKPNIFSYRDMISKVVVDERSMTFRLRKEVKNKELIAEIGAQLYKELKSFLKSRNGRISMRPETKGGITDLKFTFPNVAKGGEFNNFDLEFLQSKFDMTPAQTRKVMNIINKGKEE